MPAAVTDTGMAMAQVAQNELVQRKLQMDSLRKQLGGGGPDEKQKLRESCEGFESIFIQKMWEQMRSNVSKEGYLHSKDEEAYQSMFDVELAKKMSSAGGIGLADMLYEQLSQKLSHTSRATTPGGYRAPVEVPPSGAVKPEAAPAIVEKLTVDNLYSEASPAETPSESPAPVPAVSEAAAKMEETPENETPGLIETALNELRTVVEQEDAKARGPVAQSAPGEAVAAPMAQHPAAQAQAASAEGAPAPMGPLPAAQTALIEGIAASVAQPPATQAQATAPTSHVGPAQKADLPTRASRKRDNIRGSSWIGHGPVSADPKPIPRSPRTKGENPTSRINADNAPAPTPTPLRVSKETGPAALPTNAAMPVDGAVVEGFGWTQDAQGQKRWNGGLNIAAAPGAPVRACLDGSVVFVGEQQGLGSLVVLEHEGGLRSYYAGVTADGLAPGEKIQRGANFASVASQPDSAAGAANSALLHFELKRGEMAVNPGNILGKITG